jgi:hypothetical protein
MNQYSITNAMPELDEDGLMVAVRFVINAWDDIGHVESRDMEWRAGENPSPQPDEETLSEMLMAYAEDMGMKEELRISLLRFQTPIYVAPPPPPPPSLDMIKANLMAQIDTNVASVYGQYTRFEIEYVMREEKAREYKASGYTTDPTKWITTFADENGISYQLCADLIISQADTYRAAVADLGDLRMLKYRVKNAETLEEAYAAHGQIIDQVYAIARALP